MKMGFEAILGEGSLGLWLKLTNYEYSALDCPQRAELAAA